MIHLIKRLWFAFRLRRAVRKADRASRLTHRKHMVIMLNGSVRVISKQQLTHLIRTHRFRHGTKVSDIEQRALYITP
ncbi:MAG: hypothetical protein K6E86_02120 [Bacteroidales bacterium]|nr:hypothetical protein [Bacteroidales bacterium]